MTEDFDVWNQLKKELDTSDSPDFRRGDVRLSFCGILKTTPSQAKGSRMPNGSLYTNNSKQDLKNQVKLNKREK